MVLEGIGSLIEKIRKSEKIAKLKEKVLKLKKEELERKLKKKKNIAIQLIVAILIPFFIFFSIDIRNMITIFFILIVILFVIYIIVTIKTGFVIASGIKYFLLSMIFLIGLLIITQFINCGGGSCFYVIEEKFGVLAAYSSFLVTFIFFLLLGLVTEGVTFWITSTIIAIIIITFLPLLSPSSWYNTCKNIPFVSSSEYCNPIRIKITQAKYISVQTTGGVNVQFNAPKSMYGGEPYEYSFSIKNLFPNSINFSVIPLLAIKYGTSIIYFSSPFKQEVTNINSNTSYQSSVFIDPKNIKSENSIPFIKPSYCPYTSTDIARHKGYYTTDIFGKTNFDLEKVECASDKPCKEKMCLAVRSFECTCLDFIDLTCSSDSKIYPTIYLKNSGMMRAKLTLYYSDKYTPSVNPIKFSNNDITLSLEAIPNPYIGSIHKYLTDVILFLKVKNSGNGVIKIKDITVTTPRTTITTTDLSKEVTLEEEIGTDVIECKSVSDVFPIEIGSGEEYGGLFCKLKPPQVKATLIDHRSNETETTNVTYNVIVEYCTKGSTDERWKDIFDKIGKSGLCEFLNNKNKEEENRIINQSMSGTPVYVEVKYEKENVYSYSYLDVNTRTQECINRCIEYCMKEGKKEDECQKSCNL